MVRIASCLASSRAPGPLRAQADTWSKPRFPRGRRTRRLLEAEPDEFPAERVGTLRTLVSELEEVNEIELVLGEVRDAHGAATGRSVSGQVAKLEADVSSNLSGSAKALERYASAASDEAKRLDNLVDARLEMLDTRVKVKAAKGAR